MKIKIIIFLVICLQMISIGSFSQILYTENDTIQLNQETFVLKLGSYRGDIQWQFSNNNIDWSNLADEESGELELPVNGNAGYFRATIIEGDCDSVYSEMAKLVYEIPSVVTNAASAITFNSATLNGEVTSDGGTDATSRGFYWSSSNGEPNDQDNVENIGGGVGEFSISLGLLEANTTYYVRAYAINSEGTSLGEVVSFTTTSSVDIPVVVNNAATNITSGSATLNGEVTSNGGATVTARGFYWSKTNNNPGSADNIETSGSGTGTFSASLSGLEANTTYYVQTFATNSEGTALGEVVSFTTIATIGIPVVATNATTGITTSSATLNGEVTSDGGATVTSKGFYWSKTNNNPGSGDNVESSGSGTGAFSASISSLETNTTYYVRAFATNSEGTSLGEVVSFTTTSSVDIPVVVTNTVTSITSGSATLNGEVTSDGGATVTSKGFYWSKTNNNPGSGDNVETSGSGTGVFSSTLSGLETNTTYYVRAFATNSEGTSVGDVVSFTTVAAGGLPKSPGWN